MFKASHAGILHYKTPAQGWRRAGCIDTSSLDFFARQLDQLRTGLSNSVIISTSFIPAEACQIKGCDIESSVIIEKGLYGFCTEDMIKL